MGHKKGDPDCYGSAFALALGLEKIGKDVSVIAPADFPDSLNYLFFYYTGKVVQDIDECDLLIITDASDTNRLTNPELAVRLKNSGAKTILIDHHVTGDLTEFVDLQLIDTDVSSASELVYRLLADMEVAIDKNIATCLLAGIIGDTTGFQNQNTTEESFAISSELMKKGARLASIVTNTFGNKEVDVLKVWGLAMERLKIDKKYGIASTYLTFDDIGQYGLSADATSGIINYLNSIKNAKILMLVTEEEKGTIKVSLRTRDEHVNVASLAKQLGGGGHVKAAAFTFPGSLKMLTGDANNHIVVL